ncbi:MAG TPA: hypothetical protein VIM14_01590 [Polyangia bacterium]
MSIHASDESKVAHGVIVLAAFLGGFGSLSACKQSYNAPELPQYPKSGASAPRRAAKEVSYRSSAGTPIAPMVIADDPAPILAQPASNSQAGPRATLNGDPNGISRETLNRAVQGAMGSLAACFSSLTADPMVSVSFEADPNGRPSLVRVNGAPSDAEHCIRNIVQNIRFPSFEGKGVQVDLPLSFHRVARPAQNATGEQAPGAVPLFLEP